jgi:hypothetical protein
MMDYEMTVKIPIRNVLNDKSIQEAKVTSEIWLKSVAPDAELIEFSRVEGSAIVEEAEDKKDSLGKCVICGKEASVLYPLLPGAPAFCDDHHNPKDAGPYGCDFSGPDDFDIPFE